MMKFDDYDNKLLNFKIVLDIFFLVRLLRNISHHFKSQHKVTLLTLDMIDKTIDTVL